MAKQQVICTYDGALSHPDHRRHVIVGGIKFDADDPLVKAYPWAFEKLDASASDLVREPVRSIPLKRRDGGDVEQATAAPGERRTTSRKRTSRKKTAAKKTTDDK